MDADAARRRFVPAAKRLETVGRSHRARCRRSGTVDARPARAHRARGSDALLPAARGARSRRGLGGDERARAD